MTWAEFLPLFFLAVMGLSLLAYVILDGYDLGVGLLLLPAGCLLPRPLPLPHLPLSLLPNAPLASPAGACGTWTRAP